jgi:hypothetical protein
MLTAQTMTLDTDTMNDCLVDLPAFDTSMDLDNAKFMDHIRKVFSCGSSGFFPEMDAWIGGE